MSLTNVLIVLSPFLLLVAMLGVWKDDEEGLRADPITHHFTRRWLMWVVGLIIVVSLIGGLR